MLTLEKYTLSYKTMNEDEKHDFLLENGWTKIDTVRWKNPNMATNPKDYFLYSAFETAEGDNIIDKRNIHYKVFKNEFGYGFDVRGRESKMSNSYSKWTTFNYVNKEDAELLVRNLNTGSNHTSPPPVANTYRKILIVKEGNANRYFYVPTFNLFCKAALKIILERDRLGNGYWYYFEKTRPVSPSIPENKIAEMPFAKDRQNALNSWAFFKKDLKEYYFNIKMKKMYKKIIENKNPIDAAFFFHARRNETFENYELVDCESVF